MAVARDDIRKLVGYVIAVLPPDDAYSESMEQASRKVDKRRARGWCPLVELEEVAAGQARSWLLQSSGLRPNLPFQSPHANPIEEQSGVTRSKVPAFAGGRCE